VTRIRIGSATVLRLLTLLSVAVAASLTAGLTTAPRSEAYWVCAPFAPVVRAPDFRCAGTQYSGGLSYIEKNSSPRAYGVYRSSVPGGGSVSGEEYFSGSNDYFLQDFGCGPGYANAHNRNSINNTVQYTLAGNC
jgi:hypothetical protein